MSETMVKTTTDVIPQGCPVDPEIFEGVKNLLEKDTAITCPVTEEFLLRFIWSSDLDVRKSYHLVQEYFQARRDYPSVFLLGDPHTYLPAFRSNELGYELSDRDPLGRRVFVANVGDIDPSRHRFEDVLQSCLMVMEALSVEPDVQRLGIVVLVSISRFSFSLVRWFTPYKIKISMKFLQDCIPLAMQQLYLVNAPRVFSITFNAFKPLMKEEFKRKISWHNGDLASLHKVLPPSILPEEFGGVKRTEDWEGWYSHILRKAPMFKELRSYGYLSTKT